MIILSTSDTGFLIISRNDEVNVNVRVINQDTNTEIYNQNLILIPQGYYFQVEDSNGFGLVENNNYIVEIRDGDLMVFRDQIFCTNQTTYSLNDGIFKSNVTENKYIIFDN